MNSLEPSQPREDAQHEHFAQLIARGDQSQGVCCAEAYGLGEVGNTAYAAASRLLRNVEVQAHITTLREQAAEEAVVDVKLVLTELLENVYSAKQGNPVFNRIR